MLRLSPVQPINWGTGRTAPSVSRPHRAAASRSIRRWASLPLYVLVTTPA
ncbi:hypothetical protein [Streptomyces cremeus]